MNHNSTGKPILQAENTVVQTLEWGRLRWFANGQLGNSETMTLGQCTLKPGCENPRHLHPNCEEILQVIEGTISQSVVDELFEMGPGDTIVIPPNVIHNARNTGDTDAVMTIAFSSPDRQTEGEF